MFTIAGALGMHGEVRRPDRDDYVDIYYAYIHPLDRYFKCIVGNIYHVLDNRVRNSRGPGGHLPLDFQMPSRQFLRSGARRAP